MRDDMRDGHTRAPIAGERACMRQPCQRVEWVGASSRVRRFGV